ncbi:MAG: 23S rRNA (adenine(2503)-C(2))-methyltransferase RlmN [Anaerolineales bacterium]
MDKVLFFDIDLDKLNGTLDSWGEPNFRAKQVWQGIYKQLKATPEEIQNIPKPLRTKLLEEFSFSYLKPEITLSSKDGETTKTLFRLPDNQSIETVLMSYTRRQTLCISTQSGCAMGCVFCATGQMGFRRNLSSGEIIEQVLFFARQIMVEGTSVTNVVLMGMGEPFHNYDSTMEAIDRLNHPDGLNLSARRFTISTVGLVPMIKRFTKEKRQINLAVSLHAIDDDLRSTMIPLNKKYPVEQLLNCCRDYVKTTRRRITFEWALINDVNDSIEQANKLGRRLRLFILDGAPLCHVNVIPLNPTQGYGGKATTRERAIAFKSELERLSIPCSIRIRRGIDIKAGCGQLADFVENK